MLAAYLPLETVYQFHETAETWILRRYAPTVQVGAGAERTRPATYTATPIQLFRDRSSKSTVQAVQGQRGPDTHTVYTRTKLLVTDDQRATGAQPADVLINPADGQVWQVIASADWEEARGYQVEIERCGSLGTPPWA